MPPSAATSDGRPHYQGLDLLRGVAALAVVGFHFSSRLDLPGLFWHGYLGVDFFFALSGFVIAHAYGARLASGELRVRSFIVLRLVRLLPLVVFGTLLAAVIELLRPGDFSVARHLTDLALALLMGCLCIPTLWHTTLEPTVFPLNSPVWSLFFELVANAGCVPFYRSRRAGPAVVALMAVSLLALAGTTLVEGNVDVGSIPANFFSGFPRMAWSFSLGILLSRVKRPVVALNRWVFVAALAAILDCPALPDGVSSLFDLFAVCVAFPLIVLGAAHCRGAERHCSLSAWSGDMSYPLYATHYPLVRAVGLIGRKLSDSTAAHVLLVMIASAAMVAFSMAVYVVYDGPIRRWLTARLGMRPIAVAKARSVL